MSYNVSTRNNCNMLDTINFDSPDDPREDKEFVEQLKISLSNIEKILGHPPEIIVMNLRGFEQWFEYCQEKGIDPKTFAGIEIVLNKEQVFEWAFIAVKNDLVRKRFGLE